MISNVPNEFSLSVVIITKDEEYGIKRCLDSVFSELSKLNSWEVILIDSNSSDSTVDIAINYSCDIYKIQGKGLSASLGRFIGTNKSLGRFILFLDGDMELCKGWLEKAINVLETDINAAGVIGIRSDVIYNEEKEIVKRISNVYDIQNLSVTKHFGGALLAKRKVIEKIGGYDPRMSSNEEPELHSRIIKAGYHVLQMPVPMIIHHDDSNKKKIKERLLRTISNRYMGLALGFKYSFGKRNVFNYTVKMKSFLIPIILDLLSILLLFTLFLFSPNSRMYVLINVVLSLQISSFIFTLLIGKPKRYLQSKLTFISFIRSLFSKVTLKYNVKEISKEV